MDLRESHTKIPEEIVKSSILYYTFDFKLEALTADQRIALAAAGIILLTLAVIANIATIVTIFGRKIRPFFQACLLSLACSDLMTAIFTATVYFSQFSTPLTSAWYLGEMMCGFSPFVQTTSILVNSITLLGIALDRYLAVIRVMKRVWEPSKAFCATCVVLVWGLAAAISSPMMTSYYILPVYVFFTEPTNHSIITGREVMELCTSDRTANAYYFIIVFCVVFLPLLLTFFWLNTVIAKEIWNRRRPIEHPQSYSATTTTIRDDSTELKETTETGTETNTVSAAIKGREKEAIQECYTSAPEIISEGANSLPKKATEKNRRSIRQLRMFKVIVILMIVFFVCRLPTWIYLLVKLSMEIGDNLHFILHFSFGLLSMVNCILNPLMYTFLTESLLVTTAIASFCQKCFLCKGRRSESIAQSIVPK